MPQYIQAVCRLISWVQSLLPLWRGPYTQNIPPPVPVILPLRLGVLRMNVWEGLGWYSLVRHRMTLHLLLSHQKRITAFYEVESLQVLLHLPKSQDTWALFPPLAGTHHTTFHSSLPSRAPFKYDFCLVVCLLYFFVIKESPWIPAQLLGPHSSPWTSARQGALRCTTAARSFLGLWMCYSSAKNYYSRINSLLQALLMRKNKVLLLSQKTTAILQALKITQPPVSGHATHSSRLCSSLLCMLICKPGGHLAADAPKLPQHLARNRDVIPGKCQAREELSTQELIQSTDIYLQ